MELPDWAQPPGPLWIPRSASDSDVVWQTLDGLDILYQFPDADGYVRPARPEPGIGPGEPAGKLRRYARPLVPVVGGGLAGGIGVVMLLHFLSWGVK